MKKVYFIFSLLLQFTSNAQELFFNNRNLPIIEVAEYKKDNSLESFEIPMDFGNFAILNEGSIQLLMKNDIIQIDLIYTDEPKGADLSILNSNRMSTLLKTFPSLNNNAYIQLKIFKQINFLDADAAKKMYHGFVVYFRKKQSEASMIKEIEYIENLFIEPSKVVDLGSEEVITLNSNPLNSNQLEKKTILKDSTIIEEEKVSEIYQMISGASVPAVYIPNLPIKGLEDVFNRNKWLNMSVCVDVTGSMSPYTAQLLVWLKLTSNIEKTEQFVFFNDGDRKLDNQKKIGSTNGVYFSENTTFEDVEKCVLNTMRKGNGGDCPENNIEALILAEKKCENCECILIADNWAPIKDKILTQELKTPVHVILCGVYNKINIDYLNLALVTGGSIHTMEEDLTNLIQLSEGSIVTISKQKFKIVNGKFISI